MTKAVLGSVAVMLDREHTNALLQMLYQLSAIDAQNAVSQAAQKLMQKILKHGRTFKTKGDEKVSIYFYDNEAVQLIRLTGLYLSAMQTNEEDYFDRIGLSRKKGLGDSQSAEQTVSADCKSNS
ncbi:MAG: hypothetical protein K5705_14995 [Oscillospiraceae bacterium]|nr:hypothetical protein [Oscillospiraceae bacterium]